ncbi:MAG: hypothetical protein JNM94_08450 [Phycisphaerae bacterium]|nr:hypothetical protein [Phycisphaerae bacterium]
MTTVHQDMRHAAPSFENDLRSTLQAFRSSLASLITSMDADPTRPQEMSREFGLDKSLAWKLSRVVCDEDPMASAVLIPGRPGINIVVRQFTKAGASSQRVEEMREAFDAFERMIETHCGDRDTFVMMIGERQGERKQQSEEALRKKAFQGNSAIWGVQTRARISAHFIAPSREQPDTLDLATVSGLVDFRRLRSDVPWAVATVQRYLDDGSSASRLPYEPLDPSTQPDRAPLVRRFCSTPEPVLRVAEGSDRLTRYEIPEGPVGKTGSVTCVTGWINRADVCRYRTEHDRYGELLASLNTPAEFSQHDLFVHRELTEAMPPTVHLYSQMPGAPTYPTCGRDRGELPLSEALVELETKRTGDDREDFEASELAGSRRLALFTAERLGCALEDFVGYRITLRYPPIPTILVFRYELIDRPTGTLG